jgi:hypothetical protein
MRQRAWLTSKRTTVELLTLAPKASSVMQSIRLALSRADWIVEVVLELLSHPIRSLATLSAHLAGSRVEVVLFLIDRRARFLLGRTRYGNWIPPQEGVLLKETFESALERLLGEECGIDWTAAGSAQPRLFLRELTYLGHQDLGVRRGERPIADDAVGTLYAHLVLRRKVYWGAILQDTGVSALSLRPDGEEILELDWFEGHRLAQVVAAGNPAPKIAIIRNGIERARRLAGHSSIRSASAG